MEHFRILVVAVGYGAQQAGFALGRLYTGWAELGWVASGRPKEGSLFVSAAVMSLLALQRDEARTFGIRIAGGGLPGFEAWDVAWEIAALLVYWRGRDAEAPTSRPWLVLRDVGRAIHGSDVWAATMLFAEGPNEAYPGESWSRSDWGSKLPFRLIG